MGLYVCNQTRHVSTPLVGVLGDCTSHKWKHCPCAWLRRQSLTQRGIRSGRGENKCWLHQRSQFLIPCVKICPAEWFYCASCEVLIHEMKLETVKKLIWLREQLVLCSMTCKRNMRPDYQLQVFLVLKMYSNLWAPKQKSRRFWRPPCVCLTSLRFWLVCLLQAFKRKRKKGTLRLLHSQPGSPPGTVYSYSE